MGRVNTGSMEAPCFHAKRLQLGNLSIPDNRALALRRGVFQTGAVSFVKTLTGAPGCPRGAIEVLIVGLDSEEAVNPSGATVVPVFLCDVCDQERIEPLYCLHHAGEETERPCIGVERFSLIRPQAAAIIF